MKKIKTFKLFLEENNPNTPQGYLNSLRTSKPKTNANLNNNQKQQKSDTDNVDDLLRNTEEGKEKIIAKKDAIEKGLLNNINDLEPENQEEVKKQVNDYRSQVKEFDKTVQQIDNLNKTLKKSKSELPKDSQQMRRARQQNNM
jgi:vacuolar-type H+-ATPase subunit I/STV1